MGDLKLPRSSFVTEYLFTKHARCRMVLAMDQERMWDLSGMVEDTSVQGVTKVIDKVLDEMGRLIEEVKGEVVKRSPLSRMGEAEDLTGACLFLCDDSSSWVTGQTIVVDGGTTFQ